MKYLTLILISVALLTACNKDDNNSADEQASKAESDSKLKYGGSETELGLLRDLATEFMQQSHNENLLIEVTGGGSRDGISRFIKGEIDVANASSLMTEEELMMAKNNGVEPLQAIIAMDAIAIISHHSIGVDSLSISQVRDIFNGSIKNWKEVGGPDRPITIYGRDNSSGTCEYVRNHVVNGDYCPSIVALETNEEIVNKVIQDKNAIAYVSVAFIMDENGKPHSDIWVNYIYIDGDRAYSPYEMSAVESGQYVLSRPLYQYFDGLPTGATRQFLDFCLSQDGQDNVRRHGYFPITPYQEGVNRHHGI